ncbi:MAG: MFS transporter [Alphaproteobacteria bacterium]|nr:MFS transporter [Alphaproteobacteria bacterium]MDP6813706.1 MFS transporter [Alphaproteobacteria bacterium]
MADEAPAASSAGAGRLVVLVCTAQVLAQIGAYTWPALLPGFIDRWQLDNSQAGIITSMFYLAYMISVPVLVTLTDRIDPRRVYLFGVGCTVLGHLMFATVADGFWTAAAARTIAGIGWAGSYMTGLKLLADRVDDKLLSRAVTGHAASIGISGALSFMFAGLLADGFGWRGAFAVATGCALAAWLIALLAVPRQQAAPAPAPSGERPALFDFRPVLRNRSAMAYAAAYCIHTWEMSVLRGWGVAFLAFVALRTGTDSGWLGPTVVATAMALLGTWASVAGNELSIRLGRQRLVRLAMAASIVCAAVIGFLGPLSYYLAAGLVMLYGIVIWLDSSSLTAGAAGSAEPARRGATLAVHSMLGYGGGFVGPMVMGWLLDLAGGMSQQAWGWAFLHVAVVMLAARLLFSWLRPRDLAGDSPQTVR